MSSRLIYESVIQKIKSLIIDGVYKPGDKLPTIKQLSQEFNVGESSIREAIRILGSLNILYVRQGSGVYVSSDSKFQQEPLLRINQLEQESITYLYEVRRMLEPRIALLAATRATEEEIDVLKKLAYQYYKKINNGAEDLLNDDLTFHKKIAQATHNPYMIKMMTTLDDSLKETYRNVSSNINNIMRGANYHVLIAEAIAIRNSDEACRLMLSHTDDIIGQLSKEGIIAENYVFDAPL